MFSRSESGHAYSEMLLSMVAQKCYSVWLLRNSTRFERPNLPVTVTMDKGEIGLRLCPHFSALLLVELGEQISKNRKLFGHSRELFGSSHHVLKRCFEIRTYL